MSTAKTLLRVVLAGLALSWLATGCVRLNEPTFICNSDADCDSGDKCVASACQPKDYCLSTYDCPSGQICSTSRRCAMPECTTANEATRCNGYLCDEYSGTCNTLCFSGGGCATGFYCRAGDCVPGAPVANGGACQADLDCTSLACCPKGDSHVCAASCAPSGDTCKTGADCLSGFCCQGKSGQFTCSATVCPPPPECANDFECILGKVCQNQKCVVPPKAPGEPCSLGTECSSGSCSEGLCRGTAGAGKTCQQDYSCEAGRRCCKKALSPSSSVCGELNRGCEGTIGDGCQSSACVEGTCNGSFCSKPCVSSADCGDSPWGVSNACETNGLGNKVCFPGCTDSTQCTTNVGSGFSCYQALDSGGKICALE